MYKAVLWKDSILSKLLHRNEFPINIRTVIKGQVKL